MISEMKINLNSFLAVLPAMSLDESLTITYQKMQSPAIFACMGKAISDRYEDLSEVRPRNIIGKRRLQISTN